MKVYRIISLVAIALLATAASANIRYTDKDNHQTIKVTTLCNDIMKVEITPDGWDDKRLPSLATGEKDLQNVSEKGDLLNDLEIITNMSPTCVSATGRPCACSIVVTSRSTEPANVATLSISLATRW